MKGKKRGLAPPAAVPATSPFAILAELDLPSSAATGGDDSSVALTESQRAAHRGRVDILRNTAHRGGKTVTVIKGFAQVELVELEQLARQLQKACGAGGTVKSGTIEIQGDHRQAVLRILSEAGFRPVLAGG